METITESNAKAILSEIEGLLRPLYLQVEQGDSLRALAIGQKVERLVHQLIRELLREAA